MKGILPYSSFRHMSDFYASSAHEKFSVWETAIKQIWECGMDFETMISKLNKDTKAYRPTWAEGEFLWKKNDVLVHNTPYWGGEMINQFLDGYVYVCEQRDIQAQDWILTEVTAESHRACSSC